MIFTARVIKSSYAAQPQFIDYAFRETGAHTGMTIYSWEAHFYSFQYELIGTDHLELERMIRAEICYRMLP